MKRRSPTPPPDRNLVSLALALCLASAACGASRGEVETASNAPADAAEQPVPAEEPRPDETMRDATSPERLAELEAIYRARADSARMDVHPADVEFMTGMIGHHAQALVMSALAPTHGASERVQVLAARIISAQNDEIATMQGWLRDRGQTVPEVEIDGIRLMVHGADHAMHMPGMLTDSQMAELDAARGAEFDRLFLAYMIQHHEGAVTMVERLFATDGAALDGVTFKLASDVQVDQRTEIARMKLMLDELTAEGGGSR